MRNFYIILLLFFCLFSEKSSAEILFNRMQFIYYGDTIREKQQDDLLTIKRFKGKSNSWKEQLNVAKEGDEDHYFKNNKLRLQSYEICGSCSINDKDEFLLIPHSDNSISIIEQSDDNPEVKLQKKWKNELGQLFLRNNGDLFVVTLFWDYNGKEFHTNCIVSKKFDCIVYDPFYSNCIVFLKE